jgi:HEPN domain-containing protein
MQRQTARWVKKAEADWLAVQRLDAEPEKLNDIICFHCQQVAEKYLKAMLQELGAAFPRTHVLVDLLNLLLPYDPTLSGLRRSLTTLSRFAVEYRYPGISGTRRQAQAAMRSTAHLRDELRKRLGLPREPS